MAALASASDLREEQLVKTLDQQFRVTLTVYALLCAVGRLSQATVYNDGGTHTISVPDSSVAISNGTTVNIVTGATITAPISGTPFGLTAVSVGDASSTLHVSGGAIVGGEADKVDGPGVSAGGHLDFSGGDIYGGISFATSSPAFGSGPALNVSGFQSLSISGGNFHGGNEGNPGEGAIIGPSSATALISGGNFYGGVSSDPLSFGAADALLISAGSAAISGGLFQTGPGHPSPGIPAGSLHLIAATVTVTGGNFQSYLELEQGSVANLMAGQGIGGVEVRDSSIVNMMGGNFPFFDTFGNGIVNMSGGSVWGGAVSSGNSIVNLSGGHYGFLADTYLSENSILNVYGTNLTYQNGILQGTLQDGTSIDTNVRVFDSAVVNLITVPEPPSLALVLAGCAAIIAFGFNSNRSMPPKSPSVGAPDLPHMLAFLPSNSRPMTRESQ
jgi:hypothetical protein